MKKISQKLSLKKNKKLLIILVLALVVAGGVAGILIVKKTKRASTDASSVQTTTATKRDITTELSSSGSISPKDTYDITSLAEGEVTAAEFEEGDMVEKGQVLYRIDTSSMESQISSANNSLERAQENYANALSDYNSALSDYSGNSYKSTESGYIKTLSIKAGDKVSSNTEIAAIYDDKTMKIKVPFLSAEAAQIAPGTGAILTLTNTGEQINGVVSSVSNMDVTLTGGRIVRYITIEVSNPGGLTSDIAATASVSDFVSSMEATFEPKLETTMKADITTAVEIQNLLVQEGDYVTKGTPLFTMESRSAEKLLRTYKDSLDKAQESLESTKSKLETTQDTYDNYTITAPISGKVIKKSIKAGDKITKNSSGSTVLAVIYDMSNYTFEMSVDELDVKSVKVGQSVAVTADAVSGKAFSGTVTNVSLQSATSNGVTNYPVTVTLNDGLDELLPGMNVDGIITLEQAKDVISVPADSLMRGNTVYVKDSSVKERDGAVPAGFRSVEVTTGLISEDYVEIKTGLTEGEEVYVAKTSVSTTNNSRMPGGIGGIGGMGEGQRGGGSGGGNRSGGSSNGGTRSGGSGSGGSFGK